MKRRVPQTPTVGGLARTPEVLGAFLDLVGVINPTAAQVAKDAVRFVEFGEAVRVELERLGDDPRMLELARRGLPSRDELAAELRRIRRTPVLEADTLCGFCGIQWTSTHDCKGGRTPSRKR